MNEQFRVAQVTGPGNSNNASPPRIFKLTKPFADQAVVLNLGYDQKVQVDFSAIANEKITLIHVGEKLIILFDNRSTVTVEPFFDSRHDQLGNLTIEVGPGRVLTVAEFASAFPIISDPTAASAVLPAAGDSLGQNNAQGSGANFSPFSIDPLPPIPSNNLAPQEELPGFQIQLPTGFIPQTPVPPAPTIALGTLPGLIVDESFLTAATNGVDGTLAGLASTTVSGLLPVTLNVPGGVQSLTFALSVSSPGVDSGLIDSATGQHVLLSVSAGGVVEGRTAGGGDLVFTVSVDAAGNVTLTELRAVHELIPGDLNEGISLPAGLVTITAIVTDNSNQTSSAQTDVGSHLTFLDDGPAVTAVVNAQAQVVLDEGNTNAGSPPVSTPATIALPVGYTAGDDLNVGGTGYISQASSGGALVTVTPAFGADGAAAGGGIGYAFSAVAGASGVTLTDGTQVNLVQISSTLVLGVVAGQPTTVAFAISMDGTTGAVTVEQYLSLRNPTGGASYDETTSLTNGALSVIVTVTDGDNDTAPSSAVNVGSQIVFHDDGPAVTAVVNAQAQVVLDEGNTNAGSPPVSTPATIALPVGYTAGDDLNVGGTGYISQASSGGALVTVTPAFGADGAAAGGGIGYAFSAVAGASGVTLTDGTQVNLVQISSTLVLGVVAGQPTTVAFAISMDGTTGAVTVEQYLSLRNPTGGASYDETTSLTNGALSVIVTVTDGDNDTASSSAVNVGSQIVFHDDGPAVTAVVNAQAQVVLDEGNTNAGSPPVSTPATIALPVGYTAGDDLNVGGTGYISQASSGGALVTVTPAFGADGAAAGGGIGYAFSAVAGASGVTLTDGTQVNLVQISSTLVLGVVAGQPTTVAFAISMDGTTGAVTVEQYLSLRNPTGGASYDETTSLTNGALSVIVTVTDGDNDTAPSSAVNVGSQIVFHDDGPAVTAVVNAQAQVVLDEGNTNAGSPPVSTPATIALPVGYTAGDDLNVGGTGYISQASSGGALVTVTPAFGADGAAAGGGIGYAFSAVAGASGVTLTDGTQVNLVQISSTLVLGVVAGQPTTVAFAISMDGTTGAVTVEQYLSLRNPTGGASYDETTSLTNGALSVIVTVTDGDNDTAPSSAVNVGSQIVFHDDGPAVTAVVNAQAQVVLDEGNTNAGSPPVSTPATIALPVGYTAGDDLNVGGTGYISQASSGGALVTVTPAFGADGAAAGGGIGYAFSAVAGASGVTLTDGTQVNLVQISSTLVLGVVAGQPTTVAFAISMDGTTGAVTVEQYLSLRNPTGGASYDETTSLTNGALSVIVTVTDGDNDTASSSAVNVGSQIVFHDDGPAVTAVVNAQAQVVLDEGNTNAGSPPVSTPATIALPVGYTAGDDLNVGGTGYISQASSGGALVTVTPAFGADGAAAGGGIGYAFSAVAGASGVTLTDGTQVNLVQISSTLVLGVVAGQPTTVAFAISMDGTTGAVTVEQYLSLRNPTGGASYDETTSLTNGALSVIVTVTDGDNDTASSSAVNVGSQIVFHDDGPAVTAVVNAQAQVVLDEGNTNAGSPPVSTPATIALPVGYTAGDDLNVGGTGYISQASSGGALVTVTPAFGADGAAAGGGIGYAFSAVAGASGVTLTDGTQVNLVQISSTLVLGVVAGQPTTVAFAISMDGTTGAVTVEQYLSLRNPTGGASYDETTSLTNGALSVIVTVTDGDNDTAPSSAVNVGSQIVFHDDGPAVTAVVNAQAQVVLDEGNTNAGSPPVSTPATIALPVGYTAGDDLNVGGTGYISQASSGGALVTVTPAFGADGAAAGGGIGYAFSAVAGASGVTLTDGTQVNLVQISSTLVLGVVAGQPTTVAFAISMDGTTGAVTVEQYLSLRNPTGGASYDETTSLTNGALSVIVTVTDGDNDTAPSSAVNVGSQIVFHDDGPAVTAVVNAQAQVVLDEGNTNAGSPPVSTPATIALPVGYTAGDDLNVGGTGYISQASSGGALVTVTPAFGADGAAAGGGIGYAFSAVAGASGVTLTDGTQVNLVQISSTLVLGVVAGQPTTVAFAISMDGTTGAVTVEQYLSLRNPTGGASYDETTSLTNGALSVIVTVTDGDNDTASSSAVNVGSQIVFHDDGPAVTAVVNAQAQVVLDEGNTNAGSPPVSTPATIALPVGYTAGDDLNVGGTGYISQASSGGALVTVTPAFGADGAAAGGGIGYAFSAVAGASGVTLTDGTQVNLVQISSTLVLGVVAGQPTTVAFAISMDGTTGAVTVEQYLSLRNPTGGASYDETTSLTNGALSVIVTVTDGDNDTAPSSAVNVGSQIVFHDDGPAVTAVVNAQAQVVLDEGNTNAGSPPVSTPATIALPVGYTAGDDLNVGGTGYISQASSGGALVTVTPAFGADGAAAGGGIGYAFSAVAGASGVTLTDGTQVNLVQISSTLVLGVVAGQPTTVAFAISMDGTTGAVTVEQYLSLRNPTGGASYDETTSLTNGALSVIVTVTDGDNDTAPSSAVNVGSQIVFHDDGPAFTIVNDGNDGIVSLSTFNPTTTTTYTGQFADWLYGADGYSNVTATGANVQVSSYSASQIVLNLYDGTNVVAELTLNADGTDSLEVLHRAGTTTFTSVATSQAQAGGPSNSLIVDLGAATNFNILVYGDDGDAPLNDSGNDLVNPSNQGWAVKGNQGQTIDQDESILFKFVDDSNNATPHSIDDFRFKADGYTSGMTQASITIKVYLDANLTTYDQVTIDTTAGQLIQISQLDWSVSTGTGDYHLGDAIYGVSVLSSSTNGGGFRLNGVEVGTQSTTPPPDLDFNNIQLTITDGDGDTKVQTFNIHLDGDTGNLLTTEAIAGTSGADNLFGTAGNNVLIGGPGNDTLTGSGGNDLFILKSTAAANGHDIITDFNAGDSIVVDVANLNLSISNAQLATFTQVTDANQATSWNGSTNQFLFNTQHNELWYSANGTAAAAVDLAQMSTGVPAPTAIHIA